MGRHLNDDIGTREINGGISNFGNEDSVYLIRFLEIVQDAHSFCMTNISRYVRLLEKLGIFFKCI
jgi:hypothetical protein